MAKVVRKPGAGAKQLEAMLKGLEDAHARVGWLETAKYENGTPAAYVAVIHENGVPEKGLKPRPIMGPTVERCRGKWREISTEGAKAVAAGKTSAFKVIQMISAHAAGEVQRSVAELASPALAESTIAARERKKARGEPVGSLTKPLIESGYLHDSVSWNVEKGKGEKQ